MLDMLKKADDLVDRHRPWTLLVTVVATLALMALIDWFTSADLFGPIFYPTVCNPKFAEMCDPIEWKDRFQAGILLLGLPVAFWLWHWRDRNVRDQIENSRNDINLKEFLEIQKNCAGLFDESLPQAARDHLQIAALHQLRGFIRGDYGRNFRQLYT